MFIRIATGIASVVALLTLVILIARRAPSTVHAKRTYHAPIDKVWTAWTDPAVIKLWWGPKDYVATHVENDFRIGGKFVFCMKAVDEEQALCNAGTYDQIEVGVGFAATVGFSDEQGNLIPGKQVPVAGHWPDFVKMNVTFQDKGKGQTRVDVFERGVPMIMKFPAKWGWRQQLAKLDKLL